MIPLPTFIYPPTIRWGPAFQRPQQLLRALARLGHQAVFCDRSLRQSVYRKQAPNLFIAGQWEEVVRRRYEDPVLLISYPRHHGLLETFPGRPFTVFDFLDEPVDEFRHWLRGYREIMKAADIVIVCSDRLHDLASRRHRRVFTIKNAAEYEHFAPVARDEVDPHPDLVSRGPVLGFIGAIESWVDFDLIRQVARARPDWKVAMVGKISTNVASLQPSPNVVFLGPQPYERLPEYMAAFDVALIPFQVRNMTHSANPIKMYEYVAAGLPVVATDIAECRGHEPLIRTAGNVRGFIEAIEVALPERRNRDLIQKRLEFASKNTWTGRAQILVDLVYAHKNRVNQPQPWSSTRKRRQGGLVT